MSITHIEDKLYHSNFKSEELRLNTYLAIHATLLKNKEVPRAYLKSNINSEQDIFNFIKTILLSDFNKIVEETNSLLASIGISTKSLISLSAEQKAEIISVLENLLLDGWGSGQIHYEFLRVSPKETCNLIKLLRKQNSNFGICYELIPLLEKRLEDSIKCSNEINQIFSPGVRQYHPTILEKSYELLIEKQWKNNWAHHSNYDVNKLSISQILIMEDI